MSANANPFDYYICHPCEFFLKELQKSSCWRHCPYETKGCWCRHKCKQCLSHLLSDDAIKDRIHEAISLSHGHHHTVKYELIEEICETIIKNEIVKNK